MNLHTFAGTGSLLRAVLRRDRIRLAVWIGVLVALMAVTVASVAGLYDTPESVLDYARLVADNTAIVVQAGPGYGLDDDPTVANVIMNEAGIWMFVAVALMSVFMITRNTRLEEETGRAELVRAAPVGRHAMAAAALLAVLGANLAVAAGVVVTLATYGLAGAFAFGAALVGVGMVFAGVASVTGQIASSARAANGLAAATIALAFILRAVGDVGDGRLSWLSPIGWGQAVRPFADERWWVLAIAALITVALLAAADALTSRRDFASGILQQRPGRAEATASLGSAFGLAVRLHRGSVLGWTAGLAVIGAFYGAVATEAESILADSPELADFFAQAGSGSLTDAFLSTAALMIGLIGSGFTISAVLRLRAEETDGRADPLLATPLDRRRWMLGHLVVVAAGTVVIMSVAGLATGLGYAVVAADTSQVLPVFVATLAMVPAMAVLGGITAALFGVLPRWTLVAWAVLAVVVVFGILGEMLQLPDAVLDISPFAHVPALPGGTFTTLPLLVMVGVAIGIGTVGVGGIRRRDLA